MKKTQYKNEVMKVTQHVNNYIEDDVNPVEDDTLDDNGVGVGEYSEFTDNKLKKNVNPNKGVLSQRDIICSNCRKAGHYQRNCKKPIQSFGIIAVQFGKPLRYLMIRRRNSIGYETFLRGRYENSDQMHKLIDRMTSSEKEMILNTDFDTLWDDLCVIRDSKFYKYGKVRAKDKFYSQNISELFKDTSSIWDLPSWGFPKGRRYSQKESDIQCATREFIEETDMKRENFRILFTKPYIEIYTGTNDVRYKHIYYIAIVSNNSPLPSINVENQYQSAEIGDIGWFTYEECINLIKPYHEEKKTVLTQANALLTEYIF
jgi:8-oxo-dGTP pyrophosphatase MutT (NUDIX family)